MRELQGFARCNSRILEMILLACADESVPKQIIDCIGRKTEFYFGRTIDTCEKLRCVMILAAAVETSSKKTQ